MSVGPPERIQLSRKRGWRMPENAVNVARPGPFGNPFKVGVDGTAEECVRLFLHLLAGRLCLTANASIEAQKLARNNIVTRIGELRGKDLACWCKVGHPCHGNALLEIANEPGITGAVRL